MTIEIQEFKWKRNVPVNFTGICKLLVLGKLCYYKEGQLHREDGPAVEWVSGNKEWWLNGKFHREDGPAIEAHNGTKHWYINGKFHREDGPAIEYADGTKEWWIEDIKYSEEGFNKKIANKNIQEFQMYENVPKNFTGICKIIAHKQISYFKDGELHREDGPAVESEIYKDWYINGKRHRLDGPAIEYVNGGKEWWIEGKKYSEEEFNAKIASMNIKEFKQYNDIPENFTGICRLTAYYKVIHYKDGGRHRENGPAIEYDDGSKYWYINDELHRTDGPAIERKDGSKEWWVNDQRHREDGPAIEYADGTKYWYINGERHREDGPAVEYKNGTKEWWINGSRHRTDGPAVYHADGVKYWYIEDKNYSEEDFNKEVQLMNMKEFKSHNDIPKDFTGICKLTAFNEIRYYKDGEIHREDGPAIEYMGGTKNTKKWYINNKLHREDGPAIEYFNGTKEWWINGKLHREDGPACEYADGRKYWYIEGKPYSEEDFTKVKTMKAFEMHIHVPKDFTGICKITKYDKICHYKEGKIHREDGPALEYSNGTKEWWVNNKRHRTDGPACEYADGTKFWYLNGKLHRKDGPAVEHADGYKEWCQNGRLHREDGPAIEYANGGKEWWIEDIKYSEEGFNKKIANKNIQEFQMYENVPENFTGICKITAHKQISYFKDGKLHREDGPAVESEIYKKWYINNKLHREDGPAIEYANGYKAWYQNGKYHREDGPAVETANGNKEWWINGKRHRTDGPACEYADGTKYWYINGERHRENGPAIEFVDGSKEWYKDNKRHRADGPAIEYGNGDKHWYINNKRHRLDGPAVEWVSGNKQWWIEGKNYSEEEFDEKVSKINIKEFKSLNDVPKDFNGLYKIKMYDCIYYYKNGKYHREDGPAIEYANGNKEWYQNGQLHREDGPAKEFASGSKFWYLNGNLHREDGPAIEYADGTKEWFIKGKKYSEEEFTKFLNKDSDNIKQIEISQVSKEKHVVEILDKSKYDSMIKICNKASYRILSEQIVLCIIKSIKHGLSKISSLSVAEEIITSSVGKALVQAGIGIVLNKFDYNNKYVEKISEEMLISSISTLENSIFDSLIASIDVKEIQKQNTFIRVNERSHEQEYEIELNNNQQSLSI